MHGTLNLKHTWNAFVNMCIKVCATECMLEEGPIEEQEEMEDTERSAAELEAQERAESHLDDLCSAYRSVVNDGEQDDDDHHLAGESESSDIPLPATLTTAQPHEEQVDPWVDDYWVKV